MSADSAILETLARIEHKTDLCLKIVTMVLNAGGGIPILDHPDMKDSGNRCPVCGVPPKYNIDIFKGVVNRTCGCSTGITPIDLTALAPPNAQRRNPDGRDTGIDEAAEDRTNPGSSRGHAGPRGTQGR